MCLVPYLVPVSDKYLKFRIRCGERGIRTPGTLQYNGFQDRRDRPLRHLSNNCLFQKSGAKVTLFSETGNSPNEISTMPDNS